MAIISIEERAKRQVVVRLYFPGVTEGFFPIQFELLTAVSRANTMKFHQDKFDYWHVYGQIVKEKRGYANVNLRTNDWMSDNGHRIPFSTNWSRSPKEGWSEPVDFAALIQNQDGETSSRLGIHHPQIVPTLTMIHSRLVRGPRDGGFTESSIVEVMVVRLWALIERLSEVHPDDGVVRLF